MLYPLSAGYAGKEGSASFFGHIAQSNFFCALEVFDGFSVEQGDGFLQDLADRVTEKPPTSLKEFDETISAFIQQASIPVDFSLATGFGTASIFYLKTVGTGQIYIKRSSHFELLISGDNIASGYMQEKDMFVFTTTYFMDTMKQKDIIKKTISGHATPDAAASHITAQSPGAGTCLFVSYQSKVEEPALQTTEQKTRFQPPEQKRTFSLQPFLGGFMDQLRYSKKKRIALIITVVLLAALVLNVGNLFGKKQQEVKETKVGSLQEQITQDLNGIGESDDMEHSLGVISTARQQLSELKSKDKKITASDIKEIENLITLKESTILKREVKEATEFSDLAVEEKGGKADRMYLNADTAVLLNRSGRIYLLSLENKSLEKRVFSEIANSQLVAAYEKAIFFFRQGTGLYKIEGEDKPKRIIENDEDWGNIADISIYNGNIYLLDTGKDEIYKYLVAENGYSEKSSYVKSGAMAMDKANSLSIDSAVYVGFSDMIVKYLAGDKQDFQSQFPGADVALVKSFTSKDLDQLYALDKSKGILYILTKEGAYVKQIQSSSLKQADDFVVYKGSVYLLSKTKILKIDL